MQAKNRPLRSLKTCRNVVALYPLQIYCRVSPAKHDRYPICTVAKSETVLTLTKGKTTKHRKRETRDFTFDQVFGPSANDLEVYTRVAGPMVEGLFDGNNGLICAYGGSFSGKTYTIIGDDGLHGLLQPSVDTIFQAIRHVQAERYTFKPDGYNGFTLQTAAKAREDRSLEMKRLWAQKMETGHTRCCAMCQERGGKIKQVDQDNLYAVFVSFYEVYNNKIFDLLDEIPLQRFSEGKAIDEDDNHRPYIKGLTKVELSDFSEAMDIFWYGFHRRLALQFPLVECLPCHSVFTVQLVQAPSDAQGEGVNQDQQHVAVSQLTLVDLAGHDMLLPCTKKRYTDESLGAFRKSFTFLAECMKGSAVPKKNPYRDSCITHLLKDYFEGEGQIAIVACLHPSEVFYNKTLHVLKFIESLQKLVVAKTTPWKIVDTGFAAGRRKANRVFHLAKQQAIKAGFPEARTIRVDVNLVLGRQKNLPNLELDSAPVHTLIAQLVQHLKDRIKCRFSIHDEFEKDVTMLRSRIVDSMMEVNLLRCNVATMLLYSEASFLKAARLRKDLLFYEHNINDMNRLLMVKEVFLKKGPLPKLLSELSEDNHVRDWKLLEALSSMHSRMNKAKDEGSRKGKSPANRRHRSQSLPNVDKYAEKFRDRLRCRSELPLAIEYDQLTQDKASRVHLRRALSERDISGISEYFGSYLDAF